MSSSIETIKEYTGAGFKCALFDFDGTISLIREGWQKVMVPYFCEVIEALGTGESEDGIREEVTEFVDRLTGKQTIFQCIALDEAVVRRGGEHVDPGEYKKEYLRRLEMRIADRKRGLESGALSPDSLAVKGSVEFVRALRDAGIRCFLASGTDEDDVIYEASLIGVRELFDGGIHGARDALLDCSKEAVIKNMIDEQKLDPEELVTFGDGLCITYTQCVTNKNKKTNNSNEKKSLYPRLTPMRDIGSIGSEEIQSLCRRFLQPGKPLRHLPR
ncbi:HAD family hydrolase [Leyella stercorea]|uniref:HAD family hydrolase n=1 Tax=Leyella stercorea TaxID=363265 RepID=UPI002FDA8622